MVGPRAQNLGFSLAKMKRKTLFALNRLRFAIRFQKVLGQMRIVVPMKYRRAVRLIRHGITIIGLLSAFVLFSSVWIAFPFGVALHFLGLGIERAAFSNRTMFIHPLPWFRLEAAKWVGVGFGFGTWPGMDGDIKFLVLEISDPEYAKKLFSLIQRWLSNDINNAEDRIQASVVFLDETKYDFFLYPKILSPEMENAQSDVENCLREISLNVVHDNIVVHCVLRQECFITERSSLPEFRRRYSPGEPIVCQIQLPSQIGKAEAAPGTDPFILRSLKFRRRDELTRQDIEYDHLRILS